MTYRLTPAAEADLEEIGDRIAVEDPSAAMRLVDALAQTVGIAGSLPLIGSGP